MEGRFKVDNPYKLIHLEDLKVITLVKATGSNAHLYGFNPLEILHSSKRETVLSFEDYNGDYFTIRLLGLDRYYSTYKNQIVLIDKNRIVRHIINLMVETLYDYYTAVVADAKTINHTITIDKAGVLKYVKEREERKYETGPEKI